MPFTPFPARKRRRETQVYRLGSRVGAPALATELSRLSRAEIGFAYPAHRPLQPSLESACREVRLLLAQDV